jgi:hypothetical protein
VQVARPVGGVIAEESGSVGPEQETISVQITVTLEAACETLSVRVELSSGGQIWFQSEGNHEVCAGVRNDLEAQDLEFVRPAALIDPPALALIVQERKSTRLDFFISYPGTDNLIWTAEVQEEDAEWLTLQPTSGSVTSGQPGQVAALADAAELSPGQYFANIVVTGEGFSGPIGIIPVSLTVTAGPRIDLEPPTPLSFSVLSGLNPSPQAITITNSGGGMLTWTATDNVGWLSVSPASGSLAGGQSQIVPVAVASAGLEPGNYSATITVRDPNAENSPQTVAVNLTVLERAAIKLDPLSVSTSTPEGTNAFPWSLILTNTGGRGLNWTATSSEPWVSAAPNSGTVPYVPGVGGLSFSMWINFNTASLAPGDYEATITFSDPEASNSPQILPVSLTVLPPEPPTISNLTWSLRVLNDSTCGNNGSRFDISFDYSDPNGDVPVSDGFFFGTPLRLSWAFLPDGFTGEALINTPTDGDGFSGTASLDVCIAYEFEGNTSVLETFTLRDQKNLWSNSLSIIIPRPEGGNSPPQTSSKGGATSSPGVLIGGGTSP